MSHKKRWMVYGIIDILEKRDKLGCEDDRETPDYWRWHFLQAMNEALCSVRAHECVESGSAPGTRQILLGQLEREKQFQWADLKDEKQVRPIVHAIIYLRQVSLSMKTVEYFVMLYASLFCLYLARVIFYAIQAVKLMSCSHLMVEMFIVDNYKARTAQPMIWELPRTRLGQSFPVMMQIH
ncbi:hypothetical protein L6164_018852 [Bauhinia variegata]|uniref:Uncharacterized protein n=1 Tax=Bauhinia variegata TaxID=167791 RepID=A0ACB9NDR1_BAUVA|nr:hypothetical protein L6164_018852 [Bauhinia variegata]